MSEIKLSEEAKNLKLGIYQHYKNGKQYRVLSVALHSETLEEMVIYQALYGENLIWARPFKMFTENVDFNGESVPRFKFIK
ncbi:MAG: DUF1653 domain-containing protein [Candidatus Pacebacteria bacterium]|nr:DUF1653 domain-containing protein [Candidatus Paceibacterota bacterium]